MNEIRLLRATVRSILEHADRYEWSLQGFGMLRTYLSKEVRLHVWNSRFAVPNVSTIHDHPWDFTSLIVSGRVTQYRFTESADPNIGEPFSRQTIRCGVGGGLVHGCEMNAPELVRLRRSYLETYDTGERYGQTANEVHHSLPDDGTVTIVERTFRADTEHARVYYNTQEWVSAEPRPATQGEVQRAIAAALEVWTSEVPA